MATQTKTGTRRNTPKTDTGRTAPKTDTRRNDLFDLQAAAERFGEANRKAGNHYLDLYERTVAQLADLEVKTAETVKLPAVSSIAKTHADVSRKVAGTYVETARELLKA